MMNAIEYPEELAFFRVFKPGESSLTTNLFSSPQGGSLPRKMNTNISASNLSFGGAKILPTSLFEDT
jgi:hypothetical protein